MSQMKISKREYERLMSAGQIKADAQEKPPAKKKRPRQPPAYYWAKYALIPEPTAEDIAASRRMIEQQQRSLFAIHDPLDLHIRLPLPPSVNHYQPHAVIQGRIKRYFSTEGKVFKEAVRRIWLQRFPNVKPTSARLAMLVIVRNETEEKIDLDNRVKPLQDAMQTLVFDDDNQIDVFCVLRGPVSRSAAFVDVWLRTREQ